MKETEYLSEDVLLDFVIKRCKDPGKNVKDSSNSSHRTLLFVADRICFKVNLICFLQV